MDEQGGSFVAVRRLSHGIERGNGCHSNPAKPKILSIEKKRHPTVSLTQDDYITFTGGIRCQNFLPMLI
ncbi:unnamed protein product [Victoria cruziana]